MNLFIQPSFLLIKVVMITRNGISDVPMRPSELMVDQL